MILRTGHKNVRTRGAFTLIELVLVMALLVVVIGVALPSLSGFFRGRDLDSEARRFLALVRYGQSRAVAEGVPTLLWISPQLRRYGLLAQPGYLANDPHKAELDLAEGVEVEVQQPLRTTPGTTTVQPVVPGLANAPMIQFLPTGFISETSPDLIILRQGDDSVVYIAPSPTRLTYAIQTNVLARR